MKKNIPIFPSFEKLSLDHKELVQSIINKFPTSDFNFTGLFTWDIGEVVKISLLNDNLVFRSSDYLTHEVFYSFIGDNKVDLTIKTLTEYAEQNGELSKLKLVPESVIPHIKDKNQVLFSEDRDNYDYVYNVQDLIELSGGENQKKRQHLNRFSQNHGAKASHKELDLNDLDSIKDIEKLMSTWQKVRDKDVKEVSDEFIAIKKALDHHQTLGIRAFGIYHDKDLIGFNLFEVLPGKMVISHFHKADTNYRGIYEHMTHNFAKHLVKMDIQSINVEQDLGIPGLRRAKESYRPHTFIKKYTVERIK